MATSKLPVIRRMPAPAISPKQHQPMVPVAGLQSQLSEMGIEEYKVTYKNGVHTLVGKTASGDTVRLTKAEHAGLTMRTMSKSEPSEIDVRRSNVARLRMQQKMTQTTIADTLGVSQATVHNDLKAMGLK